MIRFPIKLGRQKAAAFILGALGLIVGTVLVVLAFTTGETVYGPGDLEHKQGLPKNNMTKVTRWATTNSPFPFAHHMMNVFFCSFFASFLVWLFGEFDIPGKVVRKVAKLLVYWLLFFSVVGFAGSWEVIEKLWVLLTWLFSYYTDIPFIDTISDYVGTGEDKWDPALSDLPQAMSAALGQIFLLYTGSIRPVGFILPQKKFVMVWFAWIWFSLSMFSSSFLLIIYANYGDVTVPYGTMAFFWYQVFFLSIAYYIDLVTKQDILTKGEVGDTYLENLIYLIFQFFAVVLFQSWSSLFKSNVAYVGYVIFIYLVKYK